MYEPLTELMPELSEGEYGNLIVDRESKGTIDDPIRSCDENTYQISAFISKDTGRRIR